MKSYPVNSNIDGPTHVVVIQTEEWMATLTTLDALKERIAELEDRLRKYAEPKETYVIPPIESKIVKVHITEIYRPGPVMPPEVE